MSNRTRYPAERTRGSGWSVAEWLLGIVGGIALFLGLFVAFGNEDEYIGLGGDVSWRVGDVSNAWMFGLLIVGVAMLVGLGYMVLEGRGRTRVMSTPLQDLLFHSGVFVVVNAFIWVQDIALGDGLDYALYVTIPWGIGLLIHMATYLSAALRRPRGAHVPSRADAERKELEHH